MKKKIYIFSGLGADERVFQKLDFSGYDATFIQWIPTQKEESIEWYAKRIISQIQSPKPILIGLSFGGIMAVEVGKQIETEKIILLASAKTKFEIPFYFRFAGWLGLPKIIPAALLKHANFMTYWIFGVESPFEKALLKQILEETDSVFLKWALLKVACWKNTFLSKNVTHIHGTKDRILPFCFVSCDFTIKSGGHFMTLNKSEELMSLLKRLLGN